MCLGYVGAASSCQFTSQLHQQQITAQSSTPSSLVPAALSSAHLISVKKQFNHRWAQSLHTNSCDLSHSTLSLWVPFLSVRTCCASDPVTGTKRLLGMNPTLSLLPCFTGASTGLFLLLEPMPRLCLNIAWACHSRIGCSHAFKASSRLLYLCPESCGTSTTCEELAACQASEQEPGHGRRVRKAADGCAVVSGMWRLADLILLLCHFLGLFALHKHQHLPGQTKILSSQALFKTPRGGRVVEG